MEIIKSQTRIPFMKLTWPMVIFSLIITSASLVSILTKGFRFGVDFAGGVEIVVKFSGDRVITADDVRVSLAKLGLKDASVQSFGATTDKKDNEFIIHFGSDFVSAETFQNQIQKDLPGVKVKTAGFEKIYLTLPENRPVAEVEAASKKIEQSLIQILSVESFGRQTQNEYLITLRPLSQQIQLGLMQGLGLTNVTDVTLKKVDFVGARVGSDLKLSAILSLILTTVLIFLYIFIRFDLMYAPGVVLSMLHDVIVVAGVFSFFQIEFNLTIVAALLTLAGYSINDTIIVYDRIREVAGSLKGKKFRDIIDLAINQTLSRTLITSGTTFVATLALWIWGGAVIHDFATAFLIGVIVGTYSSVFVAAPSILAMHHWFHRVKTDRKRAAA